MRRPEARRRPPGRISPVGTENRVTLCGMGVFAAQAAELVPARNAYTGHFHRRLRTVGGRVVAQRPVWPMIVVVFTDRPCERPPRPAGCLLGASRTD